MTQSSNGFEGQTVGTAITPANSAASGDALSVVSASGTLVYDSVAAHGTRSAKITPVASSSSGLTYGSAAAPVGGTSFAARATFRMDTLPTESVPLIQVTNDGSTRVASIGIDSTGRIQIRDSATVSTGPSAKAFPTGAYVTLEIWGVIGASAEFHGRAYTGDSPIAANILYQLDTTTANTLSIATRTVVFGKFLATAWATPFNVDDLAIDNAATGYLGPAAPFAKVTVTGSQGLPVHVPRTDGSGGETLTATVSVGNGTGSYTYAVLIEQCASADFTSSAVTTVADTRGTYQASPTFTYAPTVIAYYRVTPFALPA